MIGMYLIVIGTMKSLDTSFDIPTDRSVVIKNGIEDFPIRKIYKKGEPIKLIHHCTPWRGLNVLLRAMQEIKNPNIILDVYSSTQVYGMILKKLMTNNLNLYMNKQRNFLM